MMHFFDQIKQPSQVLTEIADFEESIDTNYVCENYTFARNNWRRNTFNKISSEVKHEFSKLIYQEVKHVVTNNEVLNAIALGNVTREDFKKFVVQHYFSSD